MATLRALIIGGNGIISRSVTRRAVEVGFDVTVVNRGVSTTRPPLTGVRELVGDASDIGSIASAIGSETFDVVAQFRSFLPAQVASDIGLFTGRAGQYVYVSSASAYQKPVTRLPITESTPLKNPFWQYSRDKIASEDLLVAAYREAGFPATIVRPSHTYDETLIPVEGGWTVLDRMRRGLPVVVHGDGTSLWTLTHARDFAVGFVGLMGNPVAVGDTFQITSDFVYPWDAIYRMLGAAAGVDPTLVHVASESIAAEFPEWGPNFLGDKSHSVVFDNTKIRSVVPEFNPTTTFDEGAREIVAWYEALEARRTVDPDLNAHFDALVRKHSS
ncbi:MAG TPA: NAD-dependent epimerase/dehydratase family protein [Galbitalea sp.]|jgi:nucleoside-diphosphate-sugar epimerase|nr:NAD-dependent epimerase/dehydratase family protein [Galbitalea sp.]